MAQTICLTMQETQETQLSSLNREDPLEEEMAIHSVFLPGKFLGQRSLAGYSPRGHKESDTTEQLSRSTTYMWGPHKNRRPETNLGK